MVRLNKGMHAESNFFENLKALNWPALVLSDTS